jgi:hypothetical protein
MTVEGTLEGLASARARGRVGGRPPKLTGARLGQAQRMLDEGELAAGEIAGVVGVGRSTLYENLSADKDGGDCVLVIYRNTRPGKVDPDTNRRYGETGQSEKVQLEADRKWWLVAPARQPRLKGIVYVVNGGVAVGRFSGGLSALGVSRRLPRGRPGFGARGWRRGAGRAGRSCRCRGRRGAA